MQRWYGFTRDIEYRRHLPTVLLHRDFIAVNSKNGPPPLLDMLPGYAQPEGMASSQQGATHKWSPGVVEAFTLALRLGLASNALLSALGPANLRASGWNG